MKNLLPKVRLIFVSGMCSPLLMYFSDSPKSTNDTFALSLITTTCYVYVRAFTVNRSCQSQKGPKTTLFGLTSECR